jgi:hypothetical protein
MFIVKLKDGTDHNGSEKTWDEVATTEDNHVTNLHLTLPFRAHSQNEAGELVEMPARTVSIGTGYHYYYYGKEAVTGFGQAGSGGKAHDVAEIIGAIDLDKEQVIQVRVAKDGNITINRFPISQLEHHERSRRHGKPQVKK